MVQNADRTAQPIFSQYGSPSDWPWTLHVIVAEARRILSYWEHLPEEAIPPESLLHSAAKCRAWIEEHHPYLKDKKSSGMLELSEREIERK